MLVALYRSGPLGQRLAKGYVVVSRTNGAPAAEIANAVLADPPRLADGPGGSSFVLRGSPHHPVALWIDTGRVNLHSPEARSALSHTLAQSVASVGAAVWRRGGALVPSGWSPGADGTAGERSVGLCADLHSVEVVSDVQRELLSNLVREHSPGLIALTGRQLHGPGGVVSSGSARLARSNEQVAARYVDSYASQHMDHVRATLRLDERLAGLESMDINPFGDAGGGRGHDVTLRLVDAQASVSMAMTHAMCVQALSMLARDMERAGQRVRVIPQRVVEYNRSRAVAHGMAAEFKVRQGRAKDPRGGATDVKDVEIGAVPVVRDLLRRLLPYFRQLDATSRELTPVFAGVELAGGAASFSPVRNENDLFARWYRQDVKALGLEQVAGNVGSPGWLTADHLDAANHAQAPGSTAAFGVWLAGELSPRHTSQDGNSGTSTGQAERSPEGRRGQNGGKRGKAGPSPSEQELLTILSGTDVTAEKARDALRSYCRTGDALNLNRSLSGRQREEAKAVRRLLRPHPRQRVRCKEPLPSWDGPEARRAVRDAVREGVALLHWDLPADERSRVRAGLRSLGVPPRGLGYVLLTDTTYRDKAGEHRGTVEVLLVAPLAEEVD
ncbi:MULTISPECIES: hypothetical protein [unclassified Nocardiopsis]|uniref:hypothetical protein n=1 Tax=unclassified Nocardiopsis TaxID=2649073 RepID=UPI00135746C5|nr:MULTISPECIES: hypothetical protein [unclassified Nocardiopsis]